MMVISLQGKMDVYIVSHAIQVTVMRQMGMTTSDTQVSAGPRSMKSLLLPGMELDNALQDVYSVLLLRMAQDLITPNN